ncbi:hypothetical protein [Enterococcus sp. 5H]|uniref:hypothetical protein n=1 Tax=Enterococcus sp. 5H TaxID=1229490 RepID=UPI0023029719|nr:hypothetical protein [Enterococcus sp. 5H]MDA9470775.1 hypothetical protein [Enterococcus sp. 5H]
MFADEESKDQDNFEYYGLDIPISLNQNLKAYINIDKIKSFILNERYTPIDTPLYNFRIGAESVENPSQEFTFYSKISINHNLGIKHEPILILKSFGDIQIVIDGNTRVSNAILNQKNATISAFVLSIPDLLLHELYLNDYSKVLLEYRLEFFRIYEKTYGISAIY